MNSAVPTSDDHNFLGRSVFCAFFDSMERSLSLESKNMPMDGIWCHIVSEKVNIELSALIIGVLDERYCYVSMRDN